MNHQHLSSDIRELRYQERIVVDELIELDLSNRWELDDPDYPRIRGVMVMQILAIRRSLATYCNFDTRPCLACGI